MGPRKNLDTFIEETRERQRNIVFPDTVRNARSADAFFWRGSSRPTFVQRIAAWMFGLGFIAGGIEAFWLAFVSRSSFAEVLFLVSMSVMSVWVGTRIFRNGFPRSAKTTTSRPRRSN